MATNLLVGYPGDGVAKVVITAVAGSTGQTIDVAFKTSAGAAFNLTGYTVVLSANFNGAASITRAAVVVTNAANGLATFTDSADALVDSGTHTAQFKLTATGVVAFSEEFLIRVLPVIDNPAPEA